MNNKKMGVVSAGRRAAAGLAGSVLVVALVLSFSGCKATLEQGGAYAPVVTNSDGTISAVSAPEPVFFEIDAAFDLAYAAIDGAFKFERDNRDMLWKISPNVKHALDELRPKAADVVRRYSAARKAYMANPVPAGLDTLQRILAEAQSLGAAAAAAAQPGK
jgi:hypothetical protein